MEADYGQIIINKMLFEHREYYRTASSLAMNMYYYVQGVGHFQCGPLFQLQRWSYDSYLIKYTIAGSGSLTYRQKTYTINPNQVIFINCFDMQEYHTHQCDCWENKWIHFNGCNSTKYFNMLYKQFGPVITMPKDNNLVSLLDTILRYNEEPDPYIEAKTSPVVLEILTQLMLAGLTQHERPSGKPSFVDEAIRFIEEHYTEPISAGDIAEQVNISLYHFIREFKKHTGFTPYEYLTKFRLSKAKYLLSSDISVAEIAEAIGFPNPSTFIRVFKSTENVTPNKYRKLFKRL